MSEEPTDYTPGDFNMALAAFDAAIKSGRLSNDDKAPNYAGWYMYMGRQDGQDLFKHSQYRSYLP